MLSYYVDQGNLTAEESADLLDTYLRLEKDIFQEERNPPAPALGHAMVKLEKLTNQLDSALVEMSMDQEEQIYIPGTVPELDAVRIENYDESIRRVLHDLGLNQKPDVAQEHEEFVSNLNRKAMMQHKIFWVNKRKEDAQEEVSRLTERVQHLSLLYQHHDTIIESIGTSRTEQMAEADRLRSYRDTLYSGEMSWKDALRLIQAATTLSRTGVDSYNQLKDNSNGDSRWRLTNETRNCIHEAVLCVQSAQSVLPGVQFPYCSPRELQAILQIMEYIFTDVQIPDRYSHGGEVYNSFQKRAIALYQWIKKMMKETIHKDVVDVDKKLAQLTAIITDTTANNIRQLAGLGLVNGYDGHVMRNDWVSGKILRNPQFPHRNLLM